jgi:polysaccharide export outer membrane protein
MSAEYGCDSALVTEGGHLRNHKIAVLLTLLVAITISVPGQAVTQRKVPSDTSKEAATNDPNYVIGLDDVLNVNVFKEADISGPVVVRPDGKISVPLLHDIQASGLTPNQLAQAIASKLKDYLEQPEVTVVVTQIHKKPIFLMGEVGRQGPVPFSSGMTVLQALASGGGPTEFANRKGIYILRKEHGKVTRYPFNYKKAIRGEAVQDFELKPEDTIVVP